MSWFRHCPYQPPPCVWSKRWFAGHCVSSPYAINYELAVAQTRGGYQLVTPTITTRPLMPALWPDFRPSRKPRSPDLEAVSRVDTRSRAGDSYLTPFCLRLPYEGRQD